MAISKREAAKKIASKVKSKTKSKRSASVERYQSQGQGNPQSKAWTEPNDEGVAAKPIGYRWTNLGASKLGKNPDSRPSRADIETYSKKTFKVKGVNNRYLYTEKRVDKSDKNRSAKFYAGGTTGAGSFQDGGTVGAGSFKKGGATFGGRQYDPYNEDADGQKIGKPIGWRFTDKLAKRLGKNEHSRPTNAEVEKYAGRGVYYEARQDKSDAKPSKKFISLQDGGTTGAGSFAHGGHTQGYDDREDERLAMEYGRIGSKDLDSTRSRRDDARFEERMADGGTVGAGSFKDGGDVRQKGSQSGNPTRSLDKAQQAKPVGYRFRGNKYRRPSEQHIKQQLKLSPADRDIYFERRKDKSDYSFENRLEDGGTLGAGMFAKGAVMEQNNQRFVEGMKNIIDGHFESYLNFTISYTTLIYMLKKNVQTLAKGGNMANGGDIDGAGMFARGGSTQYVPNDMIESITLSNGRVIKNDRIYDGAYVSKSLKLEDGGTLGAGMFARGGGVERVANTQSRDYSENLIPFKGNNLEGKTLDNGDYVVLSYGYYPIWWYCKAEGKWYGNSTKYSQTTSKQMTQSRPTYDAKMVTKNELTDLMMKNSSRFEHGGMLDNILGDTGAAISNGVGGTSFSSLDLTPQMDLTNPAF